MCTRQEKITELRKFNDRNLNLSDYAIVELIIINLKMIAWKTEYVNWYRTIRKWRWWWFYIIKLNQQITGFIEILDFILQNVDNFCRYNATWHLSSFMSQSQHKMDANEEFESFALREEHAVYNNDSIRRIAIDRSIGKAHFHDSSIFNVNYKFIFFTNAINRKGCTLSREAKYRQWLYNLFLI